MQWKYYYKSVSSTPCFISGTVIIVVLFLEMENSYFQKWKMNFPCHHNSETRQKTEGVKKIKHDML